MVFLTWKPLKSTERSAIARHGDSWKRIFNCRIRGPNGQDVLITSPDGKDLRWIYNHQITGAKQCATS